MMTRTHATATAVTYGRRYLLCMIFNISTEDDDGNLAAGQAEVRPTGPGEITTTRASRSASGRRRRSTSCTGIWDDEKP